MGSVWMLLEPTVVLDSGRRRCRSFFWRVRAEIRRQVKAQQRCFRRGSLGFNYDPLSYALNFDSGCSGFFC